MAEHELTEQFRGLQSTIGLGDRARIAIAAHTEVRLVLAASTHLTELGFESHLIGSYARRVTIWPGKDVDIFGVVRDGEGIAAGDLHALVGTALADAYEKGRLRQQPRSWMVDFGPRRRPSEAAVRTAAEARGWSQRQVVRILNLLASDNLMDFSVDVVPARPAGEMFEIPEVKVRVDRDGLVVRSGAGSAIRDLTGQWCLTNPLRLNELTVELNGELLIGGRGAFVPLVKMIRQIRAHHLSGVKPSSLMYEFALHAGVREGDVNGRSWPDLTESALAYLAGRLERLHAEPVLDPVLGTAYEPAPTIEHLAVASAKFSELQQTAARATASRDKCSAALAWRGTFGESRPNEPAFPMPPGCSGGGLPYGALGGIGSQAAHSGSSSQGFGGR